MPRRTQALESLQFMNTAQICRESIRIFLLHQTHFHSISIFLYSPLPISLFISHFLIHQFPKLPSSTLKLTNHLFDENGEPLLKLLSNSILSLIICIPSSITFSLLGKAATVQVVADSYNGISLSRGRLFLKSSGVWIKLLHTCFWEFLIVLGIFFVLIMGLATIPKTLFYYGICSRALGFWGFFGVVGVPLCVGFAHVMVLGNLARVLAVLEGDCYGFESLVRAKGLIKGRKQTALVMALLGNVGLRAVEGLFEYRMVRGLSVWEGSILVSMYSLVLVLDGVLNSVFYYTCKV